MLVADLLMEMDFNKVCSFKGNDNLGNPQILKHETHTQYQLSENLQGKLIQGKFDFS